MATCTMYYMYKIPKPLNKMLSMIKKKACYMLMGKVLIPHCSNNKAPGKDGQERLR